MDAIIRLFSKIELVVRFLLSGVALYAIYLLSLERPSTELTWQLDLLCGYPMLVAIVICIIGSSVYLLYRMVFWLIGDGIAWWTGSSAPCFGSTKELMRPKENLLPLSDANKSSKKEPNRTGTQCWNAWRQYLDYAPPYAVYLQWRFKTAGEIRDYLDYRWSAVHYCFIVAIALGFASWRPMSQTSPAPLSWISQNSSLARAADCLLVFVAIWQASFLFRVERKLYEMSRMDSGTSVEGAAEALNSRNPTEASG